MRVVFELRNSSRAAPAATAMVDIRSLGSCRTLVLLNGRRITSLETGGHAGPAPSNPPSCHISKISRSIRRVSMQTSRGKCSSGAATPLSDLLCSVRGLAAVAGLGASLLGMGAIAQVTAENNAPQLQEIVVTGSHIARIDTETPSPIQVITADDLKNSGYTNTQEVLKNLTANGQGTLSQSFNGAFAS